MTRSRNSQRTRPMVSFTIDRDQLKAMDAIAALRRMERSVVMRHAIDLYIASYRTPDVQREEAPISATTQ